MLWLHYTASFSSTIIINFMCPYLLQFLFGVSGVVGVDAVFCVVGGGGVGLGPVRTAAAVKGIRRNTRTATNKIVLNVSSVLIFLHHHCISSLILICRLSYNFTFPSIDINLIVVYDLLFQLQTTVGVVGARVAKLVVVATDIVQGPVKAAIVWRTSWRYKNATLTLSVVRNVNLNVFN